MDFFKTISSYSDYLVSIRKLEGYLSIDMEFPVKWGLPKSIIEEGKIITFESSVESKKGFSFVCEINDKSINDTLSKINKTIKLNLDREIKDKMFKDSVEKLKQIFDKTDLEKLKKLYFDFESEIKKEKDDTDEQVRTIIELAE
jgi:hypothetical protein